MNSSCLKYRAISQLGKSQEGMPAVGRESALLEAPTPQEAQEAHLAKRQPGCLAGPAENAHDIIAPHLTLHLPRDDHQDHICWHPLSEPGA